MVGFFVVVVVVVVGFFVVVVVVFLVAVVVVGFFVVVVVTVVFVDPEAETVVALPVVVVVFVDSETETVVVRPVVVLVMRTVCSSLETGKEEISVSEVVAKETSSAEVTVACDSPGTVVAWDSAVLAQPHSNIHITATPAKILFIIHAPHFIRTV